jgi:uncharacterized protein
MLGSLATKLRILGYDTLYDKDSRDQDLISKAEIDKRILVTSDQELWLRAEQQHVLSILIKGKTEQERLLELCRKAGIQYLDFSKASRCSVCNSLLEEADNKDDLGRSVFQCSSCKKLYWRGGHWKNLNALFLKVNQSLFPNPEKPAK